jgi:hypothetical protein
VSDHSLEKKSPLHIPNFKEPFVYVFSSGKIISEELRQFYHVPVLDGHKVSEIFLSVKSKYPKRTVYRVFAEIQEKPTKNVKEPKKQALRKVTPNMVRRMVRLLTIGKAHLSL